MLRPFAGSIDRFAIGVARFAASSDDFAVALNRFATVVGHFAVAARRWQTLHRVLQGLAGALQTERGTLAIVGASWQIKIV